MDLAARPGNPAQVYAALLERADHLLAYSFGFRCGPRLMAYNTAYDSDYAYYSPGTVLYWWMLQHAFGYGITEFDFLSGVERYKLRLTDHVRPITRVQIWNERPKSQLLRALNLTIKPLIRSITATIRCRMR